ncbi:baseplate J/gp47 family protein [Nevskia sp.]|uniref:baseplate J/gp47 family protein n=1 Tax=Nevskia sp. TaxID=1929292 RepID=UPI0025E0A116|nr:baseplate J/gp47 family protein [Nevskia sp.]
MAFQTKDFVSIVAGMVNQMRAATTRITDFRIGSAARTLVEGPAIEIDELYQQFVNGVVEAIPAALYLSLGFDRLPPAAAVGAVVFSVPMAAVTPVVIPAGVQVSTADGLKTYETLTTVTIAPGFTSAIAGIRATGVGTAFNAGVGDIVTVVAAPAGVTVINEAPVTSGRDIESDDARRIRFLEYIASLSRGPLASIEYGATLAALTDINGIATERVLEARAVEQYRISGSRPLGYVDVYVYNGGSGASAGLVTRAQQLLDGYTDGSTPVAGYKAAGVQCTAIGAVLRSVPLTVVLRMVNDELTAAQQASLAAELAAAISAVRIGGTLYQAALAAAAFRVRGILNFRATNLLVDLVPEFGEKLVIGAVTYTVQV